MQFNLEYADDVFHGHGKYSYADGSEYEGEYANGVKVRNQLQYLLFVAIQIRIFFSDSVAKELSNTGFVDSVIV